MERVFCPVRKHYVAALPEEQVRQRLITYMTSQLDYPQAYLILEKALDAMPHLACRDLSIPERRADIVCMAKGKQGLFPLLLIECKAEAINDQAFKQAEGYNHYLGARFMALANERQVRTAWYDPVRENYLFWDFLPNYQELLNHCQSMR